MTRPNKATHQSWAAEPEVEPHTPSPESATFCHLHTRPPYREMVREDEGREGKRIFSVFIDELISSDPPPPVYDEDTNEESPSPLDPSKKTKKRVSISCSNTARQSPHVV